MAGISPLFMKLALKLRLGKHSMNGRISARWKVSKPAAVLSFQLCHKLTTPNLISKMKRILL